MTARKELEKLAREERVQELEELFVRVVKEVDGRMLVEKSTNAIYLSTLDNRTSVACIITVDNWEKLHMFASLMSLPGESEMHVMQHAYENRK